jgi:phage terminase large subunit-like protein
MWRDLGWRAATAGSTTDCRLIEAEILALATRFNIMEVAYDGTFAGELVLNLQD